MAQAIPATETARRQVRHTAAMRALSDHHQPFRSLSVLRPPPARVDYRYPLNVRNQFPFSFDAESRPADHATERSERPQKGSQLGQRPTTSTLRTPRAPALASTPSISVRRRISAQRNRVYPRVRLQPACAAETRPEISTARSLQAWSCRSPRFRLNRAP